VVGQATRPIRPAATTRGGTEEAVDRRIRRPIEDDMGADKSLARDTIFRSAAGSIQVLEPARAAARRRREVKQKGPLPRK